MKLRTLVAMALMMTAHAAWGRAPGLDAKEVSLLAMIANPQAFDGQLVRVKGVAQFSQLKQVICVSRDDIEASVTKNCVWLVLDPDHSRDEAVYMLGMPPGYVEVVAKFIADKEGSSRYSGVLAVEGALQHVPLSAHLADPSLRSVRTRSIR